MGHGLGYGQVSTSEVKSRDSLTQRATHTERAIVDIRQAQHLQNIGGASYGIIRRAFEGTSSPRQAIKAKCLDCSNYVRDEVKHCTVVLCPLDSYRPYQDRTKKTLEPRELL